MQNIESYVFIEHVELIIQAPFRHKKTLDKVSRLWMDSIVDRQKDLENLYCSGKVTDGSKCRAMMEQDTAVEDVLYSLLLYRLENVNWDQRKEVEQIYKLTQVFLSSKLTIKPFAFANHAQRLSDVINKLIKRPNFTIIESEQSGHSFDLYHLVEDLLTLFFYHTNSNSELKAIGALLVLKFIKAFPKSHNGLVLSLVQYHPKAIEEFAKIILLYIEKGNNADESGMLSCLSFQMFSLNADKTDFEYKNAVKILQQSLKNHQQWTNDEIEHLIQVLFFWPLDLDFRTQETIIAEKIQQISSADNKKWKKTFKQELLQIETNFEEIQKKRWHIALRRVAVSKVTYKGMVLIAKILPYNRNVQILRSLLDAADNFNNKPKLFDINNKPAIKFHDFGFKLLVIEELMYEQKLLKPMFTLDAFAAEYSKKEIDTNSYEPILEVIKFYQNLDIPVALLSEVKDLYQDSGIGGGAQVYYQMNPNWDPGCGDEVIKVKSKAIDDLALLPNLTKIIGLENSKISNNCQKQFEDRGILLEWEQ